MSDASSGRTKLGKVCTLTGAAPVVLAASVDDAGAHVRRGLVDCVPPSVQLREGVLGDVLGHCTLADHEVHDSDHRLEQHLVQLGERARAVLLRTGPGRANVSSRFGDTCNQDAADAGSVARIAGNR